MLEIAKTKIILYHNYRKAGSQQNWGCISINTSKKLTKRRRLTHPYIECVSAVGNHTACHTYSFWEKMECTSWNQLKFPLHLEVTWTESHRTMCKRCTTESGKVKIVLFLKCTFQPQNTGESAHYFSEKSVPKTLS